MPHATYTNPNENVNENNRDMATHNPDPDHSNGTTTPYQGDGNDNYPNNDNDRGHNNDNNRSRNNDNGLRARWQGGGWCLATTRGAGAAWEVALALGPSVIESAVIPAHLYLTTDSHTYGSTAV